MTLKLIPRTPRVLLAAGLLLGVAAAQAASGFTVTKSQEALVAPGMSAAEHNFQLSLHDNFLFAKKAISSTMKL